MNAKLTAVLLVSVFAIVGSLAIFFLRMVPERQKEVERTSILVAARHLPAGTPVLRPWELFEEKVFDVGEEPPGAITDFEQLKGRILKKSLRQGDFVRIEDFVGANDLLVEDNSPSEFGMRFIDVEPDSLDGTVSTLAGSKIDLQVRPSDGGEMTSLLEGVAVWEVRLTRENQAIAKIGLLLTREDFAKVNLARETGTLRVKRR